ncbi:MAG: zinc ribbon domain-containing protein [Polyangiales bacterium]
MAPSNCTACGTAIPAGSFRCPGCGRVFGDDNRCPSCQAIAAVAPSGNGFVCVACRAPRERLPGTVVVPDSGLSGLPAKHLPSVKSAAATGTAWGFRVLGFLSVTAGAISAIATVLLGHGPLALGLAATIGFFGLTAGGLFFAFGERLAGQGRQQAAAGLELRILALAEKHQGELYATDVARAFGISSATAEAELGKLADGSRVVAEVTPDGLVKYCFRELAARAPAARVRVAPPAEEAAVEVEARRDEAGSKTEA